MAKIEISEAELTGLVEEVLQRLARDPAAAHLWHWQPRPGCGDEPPGPSRRSHLAGLLGLLGAAALPAGCDSSTTKPPDASPADKPKIGEPGPLSDGKKDQPSASPDRSGKDGPASKDGPRKDGPRPDAPPIKKDGPAVKKDGLICGDDPCACADDPCACGDDPCGCADDPCACADDPCAGP